MRLQGMELGRRRRCSVIHRDNTTVTARVVITNSSIVGLDCEVNFETKQVKCPCRWFEDTKTPCPDAWCIIIKEDLSPNDPDWFDKRYHVVTMLEMYRKQPPDMSLLGKLQVESFLPPEHKRTSGRPKKRKDRSELIAQGKTMRQNTCKACGQTTHQQKTCPKPCTEYRFNRFGAEALKWAEEQKDVQPDDFDIISEE
jgi:hypothetical protein